MNYIAALTLTRKIILLQFLSDCGVKTRPSKAKVLMRKIFPISHSIIYYNQKAEKSFCGTKVTEGPETPEGPHSSSVLSRFLSDWVFFRSLSDRVLFVVLSDRFLSWVISPLFPVCRYFFIKRCYHFLN